MSGFVDDSHSAAAKLFVQPVITKSHYGCAADAAAMHRLTSAVPEGCVGVFLFSAEPARDGVTVYSRMFAPEAGVVEDPATGGASGPLAGYLVRHGVVTPEAARAGLVSAQGVRMGRPSRILMRVESTSPADITRVHVGGCAVSVGEGTLRW